MSRETSNSPAKKTILLVEDDHDVREVTSFILSQIGFEVLEVPGGTDALKILDSGSHVDLLLTDVGLPGGMNGAELARVISQQKPDLPILLVSAYDDDSLREFGATSVNASVLRKPYEQEELEREIAKTLGRLQQ